MSEPVRVSATSNPNSVAGAIAGTFREEGSVEIHVIGAGALNQATKALIIARGFLAPSGIDPICRPHFKELIVDQKERTAIVLMITSK